MVSENPGLKIFNNWIVKNNHIYKFTKDSKYDDILPVMFTTISSREQASVLKSFKEKKLLKDSVIQILNEIKKLRKEKERKEKERKQKERKEKIIRRNEIEKVYNEKERKEIERKENERRKEKEIEEKYKIFLDLSVREVKNFIEDEYPQIIRRIIVKIFAGTLDGEREKEYIIEIIMLLMSIKDHPHFPELLQALRQAFKYIYNKSNKSKLITFYICNKETKPRIFYLN